MTYLFSHSNGYTVDVWEWIRNFSHFLMDVITYSCKEKNEIIIITGATWAVRCTSFQYLIGFEKMGWKTIRRRYESLFYFCVNFYRSNCLKVLIKIFPSCNIHCMVQCVLWIYFFAWSKLLVMSVSVLKYCGEISPGGLAPSGLVLIRAS